MRTVTSSQNQLYDFLPGDYNYPFNADATIYRRLRGGKNVVHGLWPLM